MLKLQLANIGKKLFPMILFCELAWYFLDEGFTHIP